MFCRTCKHWSESRVKGKYGLEAICQCFGGPNSGASMTENNVCLCHVDEAMNKAHPPTQIPPMESDGCSIEVLLESLGGFYVGYYHNGDWYDSLNGEQMYSAFKPWRWYDLPKRGKLDMKGGIG